MMMPIKKRPVWVTCGTCRRFVRDTEGPSYNAETRKYFMGVCALGLKPDSLKKQFADKRRQCEEHRNVER